MNSTTTKSPQSGTQNEGKSSSEKMSTGSNEFTTLFVDGLKDIYYAENALLKALPKMAKNATAPELIDALTGHLEETKGHVARLEEVFSLMGKKAQAKKCPAIEGLITEAEEIMTDNPKGAVRDAGIIAAGKKVEHYEMGTYQFLSALGKKLGETRAASLLDATLNEEMAADSKLSSIAESHILTNVGSTDKKNAQSFSGSSK